VAWVCRDAPSRDRPSCDDSSCDSSAWDTTPIRVVIHSTQAGLFAVSLILC
jgi:hypothetical protein